MKFSIFFVVLVALAAQTQAKFLMGSVQTALFTQNEIDEEPMMQAAMLTEQLYIPMRRTVACTNGGCDSLCKALGYKYGVCVSGNTCRCYH